MHRLRDLQNECLNLAGELAQKLSTPTNKVDTRDVVYVLERTICDQEALWLLRNRLSRMESRVDGYWTSKHEYAKRKIVEKLANRLYDLRLPAEIVLESQGPNARQDILLVVKKPDGSIKKRVVFEIKTGHGLDFNQLERLMCDNDIVVLMRASTGHVTTLRSRKYDTILIESLENQIDRIRRLIEGHTYVVQGRDCRVCTNESCSSMRRLSKQGMVILRNDDFDVDIDAFLKTLRSAVNRAVESVIRETSSEKTQTQMLPLEKNMRQEK